MQCSGGCASGDSCDQHPLQDTFRFWLASPPLENRSHTARLYNDRSVRVLTSSRSATDRRAIWDVPSLHGRTPACSPWVFSNCTHNRNPKLLPSAIKEHEMLTRDRCKMEQATLAKMVWPQAQNTRKSDRRMIQEPTGSAVNYLDPKVEMPWPLVFFPCIHLA